MTILRDYFIENDCIGAIIGRLVLNHKLILTDTFLISCWTLSILVRGNPLPPCPVGSQVEQAIIYLACLLPSFFNTDYLTDVLFAISRQVNFPNTN